MPLATEPLELRQQRWDDAHDMRDRGKTMEEIGAKYNIKRQRVEAILKRPRPERQYGGRPKKNG